MVYLGANSILTNLGRGTRVNFDAIINGKTAVRPEKFSFSAEPFFCSLVSEDSLAGKQDKFTKLERMLVAVLSEVIEESKVNLNDKKSLLIISTTKGNIDALEGKSIRPGAEYLSSTADVLKKEFNCVNEPVVLSNACISGLLAIIMAYRLIKSGAYHDVIVCGADLVSEFTLSGFKSFNALSSEGCRPFDAARTGINLGEGAAALHVSNKKTSNLVIESGASANDANHISGPSRTGNGLFQALSEVFSDSPEVKPDFINAHGTATQYNDEMESAAFHRAGIHEQPVNSLKGYFGHTLGTAGILETILSLESLRQNVLIPSANYSAQGTTHLNNIITKAEERPLKTFLKTASGFGGCNAAALFRKI